MEMVQALDALVAFTKHESKEEMETSLGETKTRQKTHTHTETRAVPPLSW